MKIKMKDKNHMINSTDTEKAFGKKINIFFYGKNLCQIRLEGMYLNIIKAII